MNLDYLILDTEDPTTIAILDKTKYEEGEQKTMTLEIIPPGYKRVVVVMQPSSLMLLTGPLMQIDCEESNLPDGLYYIKLGVEPTYEVYVEKYYYRTKGLEAKLDAKLLDSNLSICGKIPKLAKQGLIDAYLYLRGAKAAAQQCDYKLAERLYQLCDKTISRIKVEGDC